MKEGNKPIGSRIRWIATVAALGVLLLSPHLPTWISALALGAIALRVASRATRPTITSRILTWSLLVIGTGGIVFEHHTLMGRGPGVSLLVVLLGLKTLETYSFRDAFIVILMGYMTVGAAFLFEQELMYVLPGAAVVLIVTIVFLRLGDTAAALSLREQSRYALRLLALSVPLGLLLFVLFPRISGPMWSLGDTGASGVSGLSDAMSPGRISQLILSNDPAFRAAFDGPPPPRGLLYWRGPVLSRYDGRTWRAGWWASIPLREALAGSDRLTYDILLEPHYRQWLLALDIPDGAPDGAMETRTFQLLSVKPVTERMRYRAVSVLDAKTDPALPERRRRLNLSLPAGVAPRASALASQWRATYTTDREIVAAALRHFREASFGYTLNPPKLSGDPVDDFLFSTRLGFCEHFSSSFTVLMRLAGIPARVVTGYQGGEWNPIGNYIEVRQSDAHAWSEIWMQGTGWERVDPTAAVSPERVALGIGSTTALASDLPFLFRARYVAGMLNRLRQGWDTMNYQWQNWIVAYGPDRQMALLEKLGFDNPGWRELAWLMALGMTLIASLLTLFHFWRIRPVEPVPLKRIYNRFVRKMTTAGMPPNPSEGALDFGMRIALHRPGIAAEISHITEQYAAMRYGTAYSRENLDNLRHRVRQFDPKAH
ncbi:MAG: DUF3488 and transglutaminase-like domain-containing protein [Pseudomonadota bacterium]|nr:DUF3488 and transglutaminase-like domain-containing protein [Pseudomonadota bacterium]